MKYVMCSQCGKRVSNIVSEEIVVRAWVECPECIQSNGDDDGTKDCARKEEESDDRVL